MNSSSASLPVPAVSDNLAARERGGMWLMVAGGLMLGTLGIFLEEAGQNPLTAVWFRCAFGLLALTLWFAITRRWGELRLSGKARLAAVSAGVLAVINWVMFFEAIERTSIGVATVVVHVQPFLVMAFGAWWWKERITRAQAIAALAALIGLALASGWVDGALSGAGGSSSYLWGIGLALLNSVDALGSGATYGARAQILGLTDGQVSAGPPVSVKSAAGSYGALAVMTETKVLAVYPESSGYIQARILEIAA